MKSDNKDNKDLYKLYSNQVGEKECYYLPHEELLFLLGFIFDYHFDRFTLENPSSYWIPIISNYFDSQLSPVLHKLRILESTLNVTFSVKFSGVDGAGNTLEQRLSKEEKASDKVKHIIDTLKKCKTIDDILNSGDGVIEAIDNEDSLYSSYIEITSNDKDIKTKVKQLLESYIEKYDKGQLRTSPYMDSMFNIYSKEKNLRLFLYIFNQLKDCDVKSLTLTSDDISSAAEIYLNKPCDLEINPIETLCLMEHKGYIKIYNLFHLPMHISREGDKVTRRTPFWTFKISLLKTLDEIAKKEKLVVLDGILPKIYFNQEIGIGVINNIKFEFKTESEIGKLFAVLYENINEKIVADTIKYKLGSTYDINEAAKTIREKTGLTTETLVQDIGSLTLVGEKVNSPAPASGN